jgi:hypothetical protein
MNDLPSFMTVVTSALSFLIASSRSVYCPGITFTSIHEEAKGTGV